LPRTKSMKPTVAFRRTIKYRKDPSLPREKGIIPTLSIGNRTP
jgi:hypothetical protein